MCHMMHNIWRKNPKDSIQAQKTKPETSMSWKITKNGLHGNDAMMLPSSSRHPAAPATTSKSKTMPAYNSSDFSLYVILFLERHILCWKTKFFKSRKGLRHLLLYAKCDAILTKISSGSVQVFNDSILDSSHSCRFLKDIFRPNINGFVKPWSLIKRRVLWEWTGIERLTP